jgi:tetratricopeptide (TPR) repeat protein
MIQDKALKEYERGIQLIQKQNYSEARSHFQTVLDGHPHEREILDRARVYIRICNDMTEKRESHPRKPEDHFYLGVIKTNDAEYDEALKHFEKALQASPKDEKVHYLLASTLALKGERHQAIEHLKTAIDLNATNRIYARNDPDFEPLRDEDAFVSLVHPEEN